MAFARADRILFALIFSGFAFVHARSVALLRFLLGGGPDLLAVAVLRFSLTQPLHLQYTPKDPVGLFMNSEKCSILKHLQHLLMLSSAKSFFSLLSAGIDSFSPCLI